MRYIVTYSIAFWRVAWFLRWAIACFAYLCAVTPVGGGLDWDWFVVG